MNNRVDKVGLMHIVLHDEYVQIGHLGIYIHYKCVCYI